MFYIFQNYIEKKLLTIADPDVILNKFYVRWHLRVFRVFLRISRSEYMAYITKMDEIMTSLMILSLSALLIACMLFLTFETFNQTLAYKWIVVLSFSFTLMHGLIKTFLSLIFWALQNSDYLKSKFNYDVLPSVDDNNAN